MKKGNVLGFLNAVVLAISATSLVFAAAATAGEIKSDPENYYLEPEEIRPIVRDSIETTIMLNNQHEGETTFSGVKAFDVRLVPGQIPMCTIEGDVAAYLYIAYAIPGPLPTLEEIILRARDSYEFVREYLNSVDRPDWHEFFKETYPYEITCAYEFVGVTEKWPDTEGSCGIPAIITKQKGAEDAARKYYGSSDIELVRYIYCSRLNGYEFSDGHENIIVPFNIMKREVDGAGIIKRVDVNADLDEYIQRYYPEDVESYFERWRGYLLRGSGDSGDYPPNDYEISDNGGWCYLHQQYYDAVCDLVWKDSTGLWDYEGKTGYKDYPLLKRRVTEPKQWALFGKCWGIAAASSLAYLEGTGTKRLLKNVWEGDLVMGIDTTEKKYVYPAMRTTIIFVCGTALAATAAAECDFPYYPEYADVYSQYDEVTPLMAKKAAMVAPPFGVGPDAIVCEPLLVRDINRMPIFYAVAIYSGGELNEVKKWNAIVREINTGKRIPAAELAEKLDYFSEEEVRLKFNTLTVSTYTFEVNARNAYGGTPMALRGYFAAYAKAKKLLNSPAIYFARIISASFTHKQILEFEDDAGNKAYIKVKCIGGYEHSAEVADLEKNAAKTRRLVEGWYNAIKEGNGPVAENLERWFNTQREITDEQASQEFLRVENTVKDSHLWLLDFDPIFLEDVPDPVQTWAPGVCWSMACAAIWTFHAQHGGPRFINAPEPGHFGESGFAGWAAGRVVRKARV